MHHARKVYKSTPKKQRRQMMTPNVIPSLKVKKWRNKKASDADQGLNYEHIDKGTGGPTD